MLATSTSTRARQEKCELNLDLTLIGPTCEVRKEMDKDTSLFNKLETKRQKIPREIRRERVL